jgi:hypothetical protein
MNNILMYSHYRYDAQSNFDMIRNQITNDEILVEYLDEHKIRFEMSEAKFNANIGKILNIFTLIEGLIMILKYVDTVSRNVTKAIVLEKGKCKTFKTYEEAQQYYFVHILKVDREASKTAVIFKYVS